MKKTLTGIAAAAVVFGGMAWAQNADVAPEQSSETYGDWTVSCRTGVAKADEQAVTFCEMVQIMTESTSGRRVLSLSVQNGEDGADGMSLVIVAPFGLDLAEGIALTAQEKPLVEAGFRTCTADGSRF